MNIMPIRGGTPENYRPEYVRMRLRGAPNARLVDGYTGASAVTTEGFDPASCPPWWIAKSRPWWSIRRASASTSTGNGAKVSL